MNELQKDISRQALQIHTVGAVRLTKGQSALLTAIRCCVQENKPVSYESIVDCYYNNVSKTAWIYKSRRDVMESFKEDNSSWRCFIRARVRQWFVSTIGILVIKNQLFIIPTIEMD
jgi:hypothetical protein